MDLIAQLGGNCGSHRRGNAFAANERVVEEGCEYIVGAIKIINWTGPWPDTWLGLCPTLILIDFFAVQDT